MRRLGRDLLQSAEQLVEHATAAGRVRLGFRGPAAERIDGQRDGWSEDVRADAERLRELGARLLTEAGTVEGAQRSHDQAVARERSAGGR